MSSEPVDVGDYDPGWIERYREASVHVHVVDAGGELERTYLLHRDYLRTHPDAAAEYAVLKRSLAATLRYERQRYQDATEPFILRMGLDAQAWAAVAGWSP